MASSREEIDVKQLSGSPEKEEHKKITSINVQKRSKTLPFGRVTSVKTTLGIWVTRIIPPK